MNITAIALGVLFAGVGTFIAFSGIRHCLDCIRMFRTRQCASGTVTGIKTEQRWRKGRSWTAYAAVITYYTVFHEKREIVYANPLGSDAFKVGDTLSVWYDANDPEIFTLGGWHLVKDIASFVVFALFLGLPGWAVLYVTFK